MSEVKRYNWGNVSNATPIGGFRERRWVLASDYDRDIKALEYELAAIIAPRDVGGGVVAHLKTENVEQAATIKRLRWEAEELKDGQDRQFEQTLRAKKETREAEAENKRLREELHDAQNMLLANAMADAALAMMPTEGESDG